MFAADLLFDDGCRGLVSRSGSPQSRTSTLVVLAMLGGCCGVVAEQAERIGQLESIVVTNGMQSSASEGER